MKKKPKNKKKRKVLKKRLKKRAVRKSLKRTKKRSTRAKLSTRRIKITQEQIDMLVKKGEERGFLTTSEILYSIPNIERNVNELEKVYDSLKEKGVEIKEAIEFLEVKGKKEKKQKKILLGKIDPIQMYLKEIGRSSFLTAK